MTAGNLTVTKWQWLWLFHLFLNQSRNLRCHTAKLCSKARPYWVWKLDVNLVNFVPLKIASPHSHCFSKSTKSRYLWGGGQHTAVLLFPISPCRSPLKTHLFVEVASSNKLRSSSLHCFPSDKPLALWFCSLILVSVLRNYSYMTLIHTAQTERVVYISFDSFWSHFLLIYMRSFLHLQRRILVFNQKNKTLVLIQMFN